ncbi:armadillo-type protein [Pyronema domesticum]|nr:armadillo-type protein [Pyronema domesticum]
MASSLANQLAKIAAQTTNTLNTRKLKAIHSTSLIFEPSVAATQDLDTVYTIASEGFQELCLLDERFYVFERSLFSDSSKDVDRLLLTKDEVKELDRSIEAFLELVSGRLLLRPAMNAVEWLVRRFRIHDQNTTALLLAFLPYHANATLFPQVLNIIKAKDLSSELRFLRPYLKPAAPVPRHVITYTLSHRRETLDLLITHVISVVKARRESHQLLSFFAAVSAEAISQMCDAARSSSTTGVTEELVLQKTLPVLEATFRAKKTPEFQISGYMLATIVVSKIPMKDEVLLAIMAGIVGGLSPETVSSALACLALIAQARTGEISARFPEIITKKLLSIEDVEYRLQEMGKKYRVDNLVIGLCNGIMDKMGAEYGPKELGSVVRLLEESRLGPKGRKAILGNIISIAQDLQGFEEKPEDESDARDILASALVKWSEQGSKKIGKTLQLLIEEKKVDIENLELALRAVIARPAIAAPKEVKTIEAAPVKEQVTLEQLLATIPAVGATVSFVEPKKTANTKLFSHLQQTFLHALRQPEGVQTLFAHPVFAGNKDTDALTISFLAKIWTLPTNPVMARVAAIKQTSKIIKANSKAKIDYQALIPLVLAALADSAERVRREATNLVNVLLAVYEQLDDVDTSAAKRRKSKGADLEYWGIDSIYGTGSETDKLKVLDAAEARKFLEVVIARGLQECTLDSAYIGNVIQNVLGTTTKESKEGKLKSSVKTHVLEFLSSHAVNIPSLSIQLKLLTILNNVSNSSSSRAEFLLPALKAWISNSLAENIEACEEERIDIKEVEEQMASVVDGQEGISDLINILSSDTGGEGMVLAAAKRIIAVWGSLEEDAKVRVGKLLLELAINDTEQQFVGSSEALDVLRNVKLPTAAFQVIMEEARLDLKASLGMRGSGPKRQRTSTDGAAGDEKEDKIAASIRNITIISEIFGAQDPRNHSSVLATLFSILGDLGSVEFAGITYLQGVLLSCAHDILKGYKTAGAGLGSAGVVRADVLVSCIRSTTSPQVQNSALLLLSTLADIAPDIVKHSVMPIFTFMGATTLRQDDEYSAHVIEQTVQRIIPPLVKSLQEDGRDLLSAGAELVSTFVSSYKVVPVHRRLRLFQALTKTLGPADFLFPIVAKLAGRYAAGDGESDVKDFVSMLAGGFTAEVQMGTVVKYLAVIKDTLCQEKSSDWNLVFGTDEDGRNVAPVELGRRLLAVLKAFLVSERLKAEVAKSLKTSREDAADLRAFFSQAMEQTMALGEKHKESKAITIEIQAIMSQLLELLSVTEFVAVIESLITRVDSPFRSSALVTFKNRVLAEYRTDSASRLAILALTPKIADIIADSASPAELKSDALLCIQAVTTKFGKQEPGTISTLADAVIGAGALKSTDSGLRVLSLVCLTSMTTVLGGRIVPVLPKSVPVAIEYLKEAVNAKESAFEQPLVHNAVFKYLEELVKTVPSFMTSYLPAIIPLAAAAWDQDTLDEGITVDVRRAFFSAVAAKVEFKTVIGAVTKAWKASCKNGAEPVQDLVDTVSNSITLATKATVQKCSSAILQFFLSALDIRREPELEEVDELENQILKVFLATVYKLNDSIFKPIFLRLVEWGTEDLRGSDDESGKWARVGVLWKVMAALSTELKSLVTDYHTSVLPSAISALTTPVAEATSATHTFALTSILTALYQGLLHDTSDFWQSPTHFDPLLPALLHIIPTQSEIAIPVLSELAAAAQSEEHSKAINQGVLNMMRSEDADARLAAIRAMMGLYSRLGEDWLGLLPETVPFIAELMEDDEENVERECQRLIKKIEEFLGEGELQGMLT